MSDATNEPIDVAGDPVEAPTDAGADTEAPTDAGADAEAPTATGADAEVPDTAEPMVSDPAKLIRLGTMVQTLMNEIREVPTDEGGRKLLARIHVETMEELGTVLNDELMDELTEFSACCDSDGIPTESEIRVAQAQLVGWLQGLLQGLQASMVAQQAAAARQLQQLQAGRGPGRAMTPPGQPGAPQLPDMPGTYL